MRELVSLLAFDDKPIEVEIPEGLNITTMSRYNPEWTFPVAFPPVSMDNVLAEWLAKEGASQSHIAGELHNDVSSSLQKPKSTPTSPSSSTAVLRSSTRARSAS